MLASFDQIYILNLHGFLRIGEKTPEGGKDENVFDNVNFRFQLRIAILPAQQVMLEKAQNHELDEQERNMRPDGIQR